MNWKLFLGALIAAPVLTFLSALTGPRGEDLPAIVGLCCGGASGITCGVLLALRFASEPGARIALGILFVGIMSAVSISICCAGCFAGGYNLKF